MKAKTGIPVGATWEASDKIGSVGRVWLVSRDGQYEHWQWRANYSDGSFLGTDWGTSFRAARDECAVKLSGPVRFKRVA
jgi:hypothetical protein